MQDRWVGRLRSHPLRQHFQPGQPYTSATGGSFGQIQGTVEKGIGLGASRQAQLSLRVTF